MFLFPDEISCMYTMHVAFSCIDNESTSDGLATCTAHVSWCISRHLVHLLARHQHVWVAVVGCQPRADI